ncbi:hypothetical protein CGZ97_17445 [Enemella evansiae]|nr:hypothetical protein CGZ97_17445 [Enemella evansiae]
MDYVDASRRVDEAVAQYERMVDRAAEWCERNPEAAGTAVTMRCGKCGESVGRLVLWDLQAPPPEAQRATFAWQPEPARLDGLLCWRCSRCLAVVGSPTAQADAERAWFDNALSRQPRRAVTLQIPLVRGINQH